MSWFRTDTDAWALVMEAQPRPIDPKVAAMDARYLYYEAGGLPKWPALASRWGWFSPSGKPSIKRVRLLIAAEEWRDEHQDARPAPAGKRKGQARGRQGAGKGQARGRPATVEPVEPGKVGQARGSQGAGKGQPEGYTRVEDHPIPSPSPSPSETQQRASAPALPPWLGKELRNRPHVRPLAKPLDIAQALAEVLHAWRGDALAATPSKAAGSPVLRLFDAMAESHPIAVGEIGRLVAGASLIAEACHQCPDPIFARDIRAEGWDAGTNRSTSAAAVFRVSPPPGSSGADWEHRLRTARAWERAGKPKHAAGATAALGLCDESYDWRDDQPTERDEAAVLRLLAGATT